ncbi:Peroxiredoxin-5, mitochondrial [Orchesella cincta]|uniref:Peroxiredoxin-5 n=1 Tax=Orchesella cincta TaxID=48709 RepID=A0A1D2N441_ORCCI|nr:Peroxiredoxin-5, mitochondrial [Orchesella cincta]
MQSLSQAVSRVAAVTSNYCFKTSGLYRTIHSTAAVNMPIKVGEKLPSVELFEGNPGNKVNIADAVKGKRVVIFGVPGAFTPGCSKTHLPGYVSRADEIKAKNVAEIICVSVNDPFVMGAWGESNGAQGKVRMLADTSAAFTKAVDLDFDLTAVLGSVRSKRYAMLVDDGVVKALEVEPDNTGLTCSTADTFVKNL